MASSTEDEFNETGDFDSYNPHPYQGGYNIALTYGEPLPPSSKTCYPINTYSPSTTSPPPLPSPLPLPSPSPSPLPSPLPVNPPLPQPDPYDRGYFGCSPDIYQFGFWPFLEEGNGGCGHGYGYAEEVRYSNQLRRAGDYLFGYSEGLGERRIGVDSYGIPIYADKAQNQLPLTFHVEPPTEHKLDYYETSYTSSDRWPSSYLERKEETYGHASYDCHHYDEPVQGKVEMVQPQRLTYHEQMNPQLEWSSYTEGGSESNFYGHLEDDCERQYSEQHQCIELEPYKPTWSENIDVIYNGQASSQSYWLSSTDGGTGNVGGSFGDENQTHETYYYEQPLSVQLEPFKPSWSQNPYFYEQPIEVSQSSWGFQYGLELPF